MPICNVCFTLASDYFSHFFGSLYFYFYFLKNSEMLHLNGWNISVWTETRSWQLCLLLMILPWPFSLCGYPLYFMNPQIANIFDYPPDIFGISFAILGYVEACGESRRWHNFGNFPALQPLFEIWCWLCNYWPGHATCRLLGPGVFKTWNPMHCVWLLGRLCVQAWLFSREACAI